jgi:hypothetical protein
MDQHIPRKKQIQIRFKKTKQLCEPLVIHPHRRLELAASVVVSLPVLLVL